MYSTKKKKKKVHITLLKTFPAIKPPGWIKVFEDKPLYRENLITTFHLVENKLFHNFALKCQPCFLKLLFLVLSGIFQYHFCGKLFFYAKLILTYTYIVLTNINILLTLHWGCMFHNEFGLTLNPNLYVSLCILGGIYYSKCLLAQFHLHLH